MRACDLTKEMKQFVGGGSFITLIELTKFLGRKDPKSVRSKYLLGLTKIGTGYFIPEVAEVLFQHRKVVA